MRNKLTLFRSLILGDLSRAKTGIFPVLSDVMCTLSIILTSITRLLNSTELFSKGRNFSVRIVSTTLLFLTLLFIFSGCEKDEFKAEPNFTPELADSLQAYESKSFQAEDKTSGPFNQLIRDFYETLLEKQNENDFYSQFYLEQGYFDWTRIQTFKGEQSFRMIAVPVHSSSTDETIGVFYYTFFKGKKRIIYYTRAEVLEGFEQGLALDEEQILAAQSILYNDYRHGYIALEELQNVGESIAKFVPAENSGKNKCEGGEYYYVCISSESFEGASSFNTYYSLSSFLNRYPTSASPYNVGFFNNWTLDALTNFINGNLNILGAGSFSDLPISQQIAFQNYYNDRQTLFNDDGIGNGIDGVLGDFLRSRGGTVQRYVQCQYVFVPCWGDPADYNVTAGAGAGSGGGGTPTSLYDPWKMNYDRLVFCEGYESLFDTGPDNPQMVHPDYDFCSVWQPYLENCILPNQPPFNEFNQSREEMMMTWAELLYRDESLFNEVISDDKTCVPTDQLEGYTSSTPLFNSLCNSTSSGTQGGSSSSNCSALLAAILNLGEEALSEEAWLFLFNTDNELLSKISTIDPESAEALQAYIIYLISNSETSSTSSVTFRQFSRQYELVSSLQSILALSADDFDWLLADALSSGTESVANRINYFLNNHQLEYFSSVKDAVEIYIELSKTDTEFREFDLEFREDAVWWLPFVTEIAKEAVLELIRRRVNGSIVGLPQDIIQAIDAISQGDILGVLGEALDIAKRAFPALQGVDTFFDGVELIGDGTRAWRAISKLRTFGDEVIENVLTVVRNRTGGLLGKFKWINNNTGIDVLGISASDALPLFNELIAFFPSSDIETTNPSNPNNIAWRQVSTGVIIEFQPTSTSQGGGGSPSITFRRNGSPTIKLRLRS